MSLICVNVLIYIYIYTYIKRKPPCIGGMELVSLSCNRVGRCWCKIAIATKWCPKALCWKSGGRKKVLVMLGYHSMQQMLSIWHDKSDFGINSPLTERRTSSANHLLSLHTAAQADHRVAILILHVKYRAQFLLGVGWGGMSYWMYVTLSCHNWKRNDFRYSGACSIY